MSCCAGEAWGVAVGEAAGVIRVCVWGEAAGEGEAVGICMPGTITCGVGEGEGFGVLTLLAGVRRVRVAVFFFFSALFGFGLLAGFIFDMSCPSCCGTAITLSANTKTNALTTRSAKLKLPDRFMVPPSLFAKANLTFFLYEDWMKRANTSARLRCHHECDCRKVLNTEDVDEDMPGSRFARWPVRSGS